MLTMASDTWSQILSTIVPSCVENLWPDDALEPRRTRVTFTNTFAGEEEVAWGESAVHGAVDSHVPNRGARDEGWIRKVVVRRNEETFAPTTISGLQITPSVNEDLSKFVKNAIRRS